MAGRWEDMRILSTAFDLCEELLDSVAGKKMTFDRAKRILTLAISLTDYGAMTSRRATMIGEILSELRRNRQSVKNQLQYLDKLLKEHNARN